MSSSVKAVVDRLNHLLGSANVFARKVRHFHWNVKGRQFFTLHIQFEELYGEWAEFGDAIAERVVAIGGKPHATLTDDVKQSGIKEETQYPEADAMVKTLIADMESLRTAIHESYAIAEAADDRTTEDLLDEIRDGLDTRLWKFQAYMA